MSMAFIRAFIGAVIRPVSFRQFASGLLASGACLTVGISSAAAQQSADPLDVQNERTSDPFTEQGPGSNNVFFDMIHRAQLGNIRSVSEFGREQQESMDSEAADFRARQQELLRQQQQPASSDALTPNATPLPDSQPSPFR